MKINFTFVICYLFLNKTYSTENDTKIIQQLHKYLLLNIMFKINY